MVNSSSPRPFNEEYRLELLNSLLILDSYPAAEFDRVVWLTKRHFDTKYALVSLIDEHRQWFKASCGIDTKQTGREHAFCAHAIMGRETLVVLDARCDVRFRDNPLVIGSPHVRFYAGAPIALDGAVIGTLCIIDDKPRKSFGEEDDECLKAFARIVEDELRLRQHTHESSKDITSKFDDALRLAVAGETAKAQFLALISHELRTPLNAIIGFAECISGELMGPIESATYREYAKQIANSGRRQLGLINRLIELTDQGTVELAEEVIDLKVLASRCVSLMTGESLIAGITLEMQIPDEPLSLKGDAVHVEQIVLELLGNAIKFTPQQGRVRLEVARDGDGAAVITVTDTGIGIHEGAIDEAFAVFGQISTGLSRMYEGVGIGLPITKKLAELHGAELSFSAPGEGGTRAQVRFPPYRTVPETKLFTKTG